MEEFKVRSSPVINNKKHNVFKLHKDDSIIWTEAKMKRENDYQPWQIKYGSGRAARRFKAVKEGGVNDNASYFVFYKSSDRKDTYEVCPVDDWFTVSATQRYKTLTAEEAEQKFEQRHKILNHFSVMHLKKNGDNGDEAGGSDRKSFKISEMDDWNDSGDDSGGFGDDDDDDPSKKKSKKKKATKKEKDDEDAPEEAKEDSDEGDFEQREVDYMSDLSSESEDEEDRKDENDVKGIAEEEALRELLNSDDEENIENPQSKSKINDGKTLGTVDIRDPDGNSSEDSLDSVDSDVDEDKMDSMYMKEGLPAQFAMVSRDELDSTNSLKTVAGASGASVTVNLGVSNKRKIPTDVPIPPAPQPQIKRVCTSESSSSTSNLSSSPANSQVKTVEDLIVKYLSRKPMTLKSLLKEIKSKLRKMLGATPDLDSNLVNTIAEIIKKLNPEKQKINEFTYFSLKPDQK